MLSSLKRSEVLPFSNEDVLELIKETGDSLRLIFFNSCKSTPLAKLIHKNRKDLYLISFKDDIDTNRATEFSKWFYEVLSKKKDFELAFNLVVKNGEVRLDLNIDNSDSKESIRLKLMKDLVEQKGGIIKGNRKQSGLFSQIKVKSLLDKVKEFLGKINTEYFSKRELR